MVILSIVVAKDPSPGIAVKDSQSMLKVGSTGAGTSPVLDRITNALGFPFSEFALKSNTGDTPAAPVGLLMK